MTKRYQRCIYAGQRCKIRRENDDGSIILISSNERFILGNGGWERVDKLEWEKTVPQDDVEILSDDDLT